jgi:hypothetical protein
MSCELRSRWSFTEAEGIVMERIKQLANKEEAKA